MAKYASNFISGLWIIPLIGIFFVLLVLKHLNHTRLSIVQAQDMCVYLVQTKINSDFTSETFSTQLNKKDHALEVSLTGQVLGNPTKRTNKITTAEVSCVFSSDLEGSKVYLEKLFYKDSNMNIFTYNDIYINLGN